MVNKPSRATLLLYCHLVILFFQKTQNFFVNLPKDYARLVYFGACVLAIFDACFQLSSLFSFFNPTEP